MTTLHTLTALSILMFAGCMQTVPPACHTASWDRVATQAEWDEAAQLVGIQGLPCPEARVLLVDDAQASDFGMGERTDAEWWSGITFSCGEGEPTVTMLRTDGISMHPELLTHELVHAAIACKSGGSYVDDEHTLPVWSQVAK